MHSSFFLLAGRFCIGCGSKFRAGVAYLEVGSSDLEQIHKTTKIFMKFMSKSIWGLAPRDKKVMLSEESLQDANAGHADQIPFPQGRSELPEGHK